jgi:hypothetical protein
MASWEALWPLWDSLGAPWGLLRDPGGSLGDPLGPPGGPMGPPTAMEVGGYHLGQVAEARPHLERALAIIGKAYGRNHGEAAMTLANLTAA